MRVEPIQCDVNSSLLYSGVQASGLQTSPSCLSNFFVAESSIVTPVFAHVVAPLTTSNVVMVVTDSERHVVDVGSRLFCPYCLLELCRRATYL